ncbi:hypothetical protein [Mycoplasmopsis cynos]|uniref:hypothetical protein n=1 Tax=Mycoplasmopsis cynos TaxID=171284 RepID=UPI0021F9BB2C|nr:hypothetical protein [Mycoplasmopsis cynos]UWV81551.1 hypothetical protein NW065_06655 [Mycoplasmopsis cynos]WAM04259.1 hypothetical protein ONA01_04300 [Mycoplasmopsis cynos]WAM10445.1 hypothetical protein ONA00_03475 [Mycoplasmopsis cynos]
MRHLKTKEWVKIFNAYDDFKNRKIDKFEFEQISFSIRKNYWNKGSLKKCWEKEKCIIWTWIFNLKLVKRAKKRKV